MNQLDNTSANLSAARHTDAQCEAVLRKCRELFEKKLHDYGAAWRVMRPETVTDQILIKVARIRSIQTKGKSMVDEGIEGDFIAIVNYSIIALIQLEKGTADQEDLTVEEALADYDRHAAEALALLKRKNHDYNEAWRAMRVSSMTDLIFMKILRTKQIEDLKGDTLVSEGVDANYMDMLNYAVFCLIRLEEDGE